MTTSRRLAAILAADVAGYSRLIGLDEEGTLTRLKALRRELIYPKIAEHEGRVVKTTGDGILIEFPSVVGALRCAVEVQRSMAERDASEPMEQRILFRIGVHQGDIVVEDGDILGDGVNVAARLEGIAEPGSICVSQRVHEDVVGKIDVAFEDLGDQQLKNIARSVRAYRVTLGSIPGSPPLRTLALPDKPSIAVLPFQNMSGDPEQEYFADGMVEEIITALSRFNWLFVIARNSSFIYKGRTVDVKQVGRDLGVRYVLEGSVRKAANRVRITGQLIDATTGTHIWADRFDGELEDVFSLQDRVATSVVGVIEPKLRQAETERSKRKPTESLDAYDRFLRALSQCRLSLTDNLKALELLDQAMKIDSFYAPAIALAAYCYAIQKFAGWALLSDAQIAEGVRLAKQAIRLGQDDSETLWMAGYASSWLAGEHDVAMTAIDRAVVLTPNSANARNVKGWVHAYMGQTDLALESFERAMRLSPLDPMGYSMKFGVAVAHMFAGRYDDADVWIDRALRENDTTLPLMRVKVSLSGLLGRKEAARIWIERLRAADPAASVSSIRRRLASVATPKGLALYVDGLRKAGLPE